MSYIFIAPLQHDEYYDSKLFITSQQIYFCICNIYGFTILFYDINKDGTHFTNSAYIEASPHPADML